MKKVICLILLLSGCAVQSTDTNDTKDTDVEADVVSVDTSTQAVTIPDELNPKPQPRFCAWCVTNADCRSAGCPGTCVSAAVGFAGTCHLRQ